MSERFQDLTGVELHYVESLDEAMAFKRWMGERRDILGVDTETGGLHWWRDDLRLVQVGDAMTGWALSWEDWAGVVKECLGQYEGDTVMHNMKFDIHYLEHNGVSLKRGGIHDTRAIAHLLDPSMATGLKPLSARYIHPRATAGEQLLKEAMGTQKWTWATVPTDFDPYWQYGALDAVLTARLHGLLRPRVRDRGLDGVYDLERASTLVLKDMENRGARVDLDYIREQLRQIDVYTEAVEEWARSNYFVANIRSNAQVGKVLMAAGLPLEPTPSGRPKLDEEALERLAPLHPLAEATLGTRRAQKVRSSYFERIIGLADGDVIHASINPLGARTGRMSISDPPLQQLPRGVRVRDAFIPSDGNLLVLCDWDQVEMRMVAHLSGDVGLQDAFKEGDFFTNVARELYNDAALEKSDPRRQLTKNSMYALNYGAGAATIARTAGVPKAQVEGLLAKLGHRFPGIKQLQMGVEKSARQRHREEGTPYVRTWSGRYQPTEPDQLYKLINYLIQGGCADLLKQALVDLDREGLADKLILPVHDELIADVPEAEASDYAASLKDVMTITDRFALPLTAGADIVARWGDKYRETP